MTFSKALKKLTCVFSLVLLAGVALGSDLTEFRASVEAAKDQQQLQAALLGAPESIERDASLGYYTSASLEEVSDGLSWQEVKQAVLEEVDGRIAFEGGTVGGKVKDPGATANEILDSPLYVDRSERHGRNWLERAGTRLGERMMEWLRKLMPDRLPDIPGLGLGSLGQGVTLVAWFLLGAAILLIVYFVVVNIRRSGKRKRRVGGILEDDEPERTADQWLEQAEALEAAGKYREAVRCLYLACLVRYDDGRVARFRRHETNWEHLYRIEASERNPRQIDFRTTTQRFDKVWYGKMVRGVEDVAEFKEVYIRLCEALQIKSAA